MAACFTGEYHHALDAKGRLIVPARFRDILGSQFKIGVSLDDCLSVYSNEGFEEFYQKLSSLPTNSPKHRKLVRFFMSGTFDVELDAQGRILLPQKLRQAAGIEKNVVFIGNGTKAELWSEEKYNAYMADEELGEMNEIAEEMLGLGLSF